MSGLRGRWVWPAISCAVLLVLAACRFAARKFLSPASLMGLNGGAPHRTMSSSGDASSDGGEPFHFNSLMEAAFPLTAPDIQHAPAAEAVDLFARWLFQPVDTGICSLEWLPKPIKEPSPQGAVSYGPRGAWPLCKQVPRPPAKRCYVYSIGLRDGFDLELSSVEHAGCNVHAFDGSPALHSIPVLPEAATFHRVSLGGGNRPDALPMEGTLTTLQGLVRDQGKNVWAMKIDDAAEPAGREWAAFEQLLADVGPTALQDSDMLLLRLNLTSVFAPASTAAGSGAQERSHKRLAALVALAVGSGFRTYWRRPFPQSAAAPGSRALWEAIGAAYGSEVASHAEASAGNLQRLVDAYDAFDDPAAQDSGRRTGPAFPWRRSGDGPASSSPWQLLPALPGHMLSVFDVALVRELALPQGGNVDARRARQPGSAGCGVSLHQPEL